MSFGMAGALQAAVYQRLVSDPGVSALVGGAIYDALPVGELPATYVSLGQETVRDNSDTTGVAADHRFTVSVVTEGAGFAGAKAVAAAIADALSNADLTLDRGHLVGLWFLRATARRAGKAGRVRRIDLRFRAHVEDN